MEPVVYLDGEFVPASQAKVSVFDHSFLYGDGCFETLVVRRGKPFRLAEHADRLFRSARVLKISVPLAAEELRAVVLQTVQRNALEDAYVRITLSRGVGYAAFDPRLCDRSTLVIFATDLQNHPAGRLFGRGVGLRCIIASTRRTQPVSLDSRIKANNYLNQILARMEAIAAGVDEAIMLDFQNFVAEATGRNIFAVRGARLYTPRGHSILNGITREVAMELARRNGWSIEECDLTPYDLYTADEVFTTSTAGGVKPVTEIDGRPIGDGTPGPFAQRLMDQYEALVSGQLPED